MRVTASIGLEKYSLYTSQPQGLEEYIDLKNLSMDIQPHRIRKTSSIYTNAQNTCSSKKQPCHWGNHPTYQNNSAECITLTFLGNHLSQGRVHVWWECMLWRSALPYLFMTLYTVRGALCVIEVIYRCSSLTAKIVCIILNIFIEKFHDSLRMISTKIIIVKLWVAITTCK